MKRAGFTWTRAYALAAVLVLVFFYPLVLGKVFVSPDSVAPAGFAKLAMDALQTRHVYALWNPYTFLGMPTFGSLAFVPYVYPLDPVFGFLNTTLHFPDLTWLLAHYLLLALAMVALLRAFGAGPESAMLGGVTLALTPNLVAVGAFGHGSQIMTAAYLPLLLLLFDRFARRGSLLALAGFAFAAAFQLLRGHVQIVFYSWLALGGYALFLAWDATRAGRRAEAARALGGLAAGLGLGFGMSTFLYLPVHEYAKLSIRSAGQGSGAGFDYATSWSFHPLEMLTFVIPSMFGFGGRTYWGTMPFTDYPNYMGIVPLALAVVGAVRTRGVIRRYLLALAGVALLISFGKYLKPLYALLYDHLPYFNKFRVPVMILVLVQFATAALAALGLDAALRRPPAPAKGAKGAKGAKDAADPGAPWMRGAILAGAGAIAAVVLLQLFGPALERVAEHARQWMNAAAARQALDLATVDAIKSGLCLAAAWAVIAFYRRGRLGRLAAALLVLGVTAVDLWTVDRKIMDPQIASAREYHDNFTETPDVAYLRSDSTQFRILPLRWDDSRYAAFGIASVLGYHPAKPRLYQAFMDTVGLPSLDIVRFLNVKYVMTDGYYPDTTSGVVLRHDGPVKVYEIRGASPRAYVVHALRLAQNESNALAILRSHGLDPETEAIWEGFGPTPPLGTPTVPDSVVTLKYDFNESEYLVSTNARGLFVQVDQYDPDWTATLDGKPVPIHRVDYLLRGVIVPSGVHRLVLRYRPRGLEAGIRISIASVTVTLLLAIAGAVFRRRRRTEPEPPA
ncbi:MAG: YfhO family protein [Hyphomicrobiales bacterium]